MKQAAAFFENDPSIVEPAMEIGAFEALWANGIASFKQLREKLINHHTELLSSLVCDDDAKMFYDKTVHKLNQAGIKQFGVRLDGTVDYPAKLHDADYPLALLYYQGNWDLVFSRGVAVVGTRRPSIEGKKRAQRLVKILVDAGFTIYSGLAAGIDTVAHSTAIEMGGKTIAVIGTPLWLRYPQENSALQDQIAREHLLISQVPVVAYETKGIPFTRTFFPERNKTMAALSEATIIVEASQTSGTLVQAKAALKQGRKVFILNNNFENPNLSWPPKLEAMGAIRVYEPEDILQNLQGEPH